MSYKQWWTDSVTDYDSAKMHVYETKDEEEFRKRGWQGDEQSLGSKQLIEMGILNKDSVVLEIGCGVARLGREFAPHVKEWYGCDISPKMLKFAKERTSHLTNVHFHELKA